MTRRDVIKQCIDTILKLTVYDSAEQIKAEVAKNPLAIWLGGVNDCVEALEGLLHDAEPKFCEECGSSLVKMRDKSVWCPRCGVRIK